MRRSGNAEREKIDLIAGLGSVRHRIMESARQLPLEAQDEIFLGVWGVKDLLAHLQGWDVANRMAIGEILEGRLPTFYASAGHDWSSYNAGLVKRYRKEIMSDLLQKVEESHRSLLAALQEVDATELLRDRGIRYKGWKVTIARLLQAELSDEKEHLAQLEAFLQSKRS